MNTRRNDHLLSSHGNGETGTESENLINIVNELTIEPPKEFEQVSSHIESDNDDENRIENVNNSTGRTSDHDDIDWGEISFAFRRFDGPNLNTDTLSYVAITKDLLKRSNNYMKSTQQALPCKSEKNKHFKKDYSDGKMLAIYKGERPTHRDFLGIWQLPTDSTGFPKYGMLHYGHQYLQKQPSFYENPYSFDIWGLPGINNEHRSNLYSDLNLADLLEGVGTEDVCYTLEEHNQFTQ